MELESTKRCAVTGASGYVGGCIARRLTDAGWSVVPLGRRADDGGVKFRLQDSVAPQMLQGCDALVHCAYDFTPLGWDDIRETNVAGTERLLEAARQAGIRRIILISTISAFEGCRSLYGRAKLEIERKGTGFGACSIRPGLVYGPGVGGMFGRLAGQAKGAGIIPLPGGDRPQYLVHQDDLAAAVLAAIDREAIPTEPVTVAHGQPWPLSELIHAIAHAHDRRPLVVPIPWRLVWLGLRSAELLGVSVGGLRSDSLVSLIYQNPVPVFGAKQNLDIDCRPFSIQFQTQPKGSDVV